MQRIKTYLSGVICFPVLPHVEAVKHYNRIKGRRNVICTQTRNHNDSN